MVTIFKSSLRALLFLLIISSFVLDVEVIELNTAHAARKRRKRRSRKSRRKKRKRYVKKKWAGRSTPPPWAAIEQYYFSSNQTPAKAQKEIKKSVYQLIPYKNDPWIPLYRAPSRKAYQMAEMPSGHIPDFLGIDTDGMINGKPHKGTRWLKVSYNGTVGWVPPNYAKKMNPEDAETFKNRRKAYGEIAKIAKKHTACSSQRSRHRRYNTRSLEERLGYYLGSTISFARSVCRKNGPIKSAMLQRNWADIHVVSKKTGKVKIFTPTELDSLLHYANYNGSFKNHATAKSDKTLIASYALALAQGLRESNGDYREGRDIKAGAKSMKDHSAEGGLHQTSRDVNGLLDRDALGGLSALEKKYEENPQACMTDIFNIGLEEQHLRKRHKEVVGDGEGAKLQRLLRNCPAAAVEHAIITHRHNLLHYGPMVREETKPFVKCIPMLEEIYDKIKSQEQLCHSLAISPTQNKSDRTPTAPPTPHYPFLIPVGLEMATGEGSNVLPTEL